MSFFIDDDPAAGAARLTLALYQPDIPQNAGTMLRACACLGVGAAIIEPAGFPVSDRHFRRSGMDYLDHVEITRHMSFATFEDWRAGAGRRGVERFRREKIAQEERVGPGEDAGRQQP